MQSSDTAPPSEDFHQNPHDSLFRSMFSEPENAAGLLRWLLPQEALVRFELNTLELQSASFVDQHLKNLYSDLLYSVRFKDGSAALIYILFEHQSSGDPWMPLRMLAYQVRAWEDFIEKHPQSKKLPVIIPLLVHHHPEQMPAAPEFEALYDISPEAFEPLRDIVVRMRVLIDNLNRCTTEDIQKRDVLTAVAKLALIALRNSRTFEELLKTLYVWGPLIGEALKAPNGHIAIRRIFRYMSVTQRAENKEIWHRELLKELKGLNQAQEIVMNIAEAYIEEGRLQGRAEGRAEGELQGLAKGRAEGELQGLAKGKQETLRKLLQLRFGPLPESFLNRIQQGGLAELNVWEERILSASSVADVFQ